MFEDHEDEQKSEYDDFEDKEFQMEYEGFRSSNRDEERRNEEEQHQLLLSSERAEVKRGERLEVYDHGLDGEEMDIHIASLKIARKPGPPRTVSLIIAL